MLRSVEDWVQRGPTGEFQDYTFDDSCHRYMTEILHIWLIENVTKIILR